MCIVCGKGFTRLFNLQRHIKQTKHEQEVPLHTEREEPVQPELGQTIFEGSFIHVVNFLRTYKLIE